MDELRCRRQSVFFWAFQRHSLRGLIIHTCAAGNFEVLKTFGDVRPMLTMTNDEVLPGKIAFPTLSIITPSFNQAAFLTQTLDSVLNQKYPKLEYIVIDGGSTDGSREILESYSDRLAFWVSEK